MHWYDMFLVGRRRILFCLYAKDCILPVSVRPEGKISWDIDYFININIEKQRKMRSHKKYTSMFPMSLVRRFPVPSTVLTT